MAKADFSLSASKLGVFKSCPRCFWLHMTKKIERPRGIFPSLPSGLDRIIKTCMDQCRGMMPDPLIGKVPGVLWGSVEEINKLRQWQSGMKPVIQTPHGSVSLIGAIDDLAIEGGMYSPVDAKTKGSAVKDGDTERYYGHQADVYALLLRDTGRPPSGKAYFFNVWPLEATAMPGPHIGFLFDYRVIEIEAKADRAVELICAATKLLREAPDAGPTAAPDCEYCAHHEALTGARL